MKKSLYLFLAVSFIFTACKKEQGCTDSIATNYNIDAEEDNGSCTYGVVGVWNPYEVIVVGSQTVTMAGQTISSFDTTYTMTPAQAEIEGTVEFTSSGSFITSEGTENYTTSGNTITITDENGEVENHTYTVSKTNLGITITDNQTDTEMGATITSNTQMTINCTRQ